MIGAIDFGQSLLENGTPKLVGVVFGDSVGEEQGSLQQYFDGEVVVDNYISPSSILAQIHIVNAGLVVLLTANQSQNASRVFG